MKSEQFPVETASRSRRAGMLACEGYFFNVRRKIFIYTMHVIRHVAMPVLVRVAIAPLELSYSADPSARPANLIGRPRGRNDFSFSYVRIGVEIRGYYVSFRHGVPRSKSRRGRREDCERNCLR